MNFGAMSTPLRRLYRVLSLTRMSGLDLAMRVSSWIRLQSACARTGVGIIVSCNVISRGESWGVAPDVRLAFSLVDANVINKHLPRENHR